MADEHDDGGSSGDDPILTPGEPRSFGNGRYIVRRRLGAGNFATVYLAYDERLDVLVAVKLLSDRWSWEPEVRGRFVQEARLLRSLNDSRVVQIRDIAETDDGRPYLVMDFATHGTLEQRLVEMAHLGVKPTVDQLRVIAAAMADALGFLHERRIAHRDIKPSNLLITTTGASAAAADSGPTVLLRPGERLMLGDLGLAKDLSFDSGITVGVGTAGYMAPEQSLAGAKVDTRTDIYAASALLAQIASGEPPDPLRRYSNGAILSGRPLPPAIPAPLGLALGHGLDADPAQRTQTIQQWHVEVDEALSSLLAAETASPPPLLAPPAAPAVTRSKRVLGMVAAAALVVLGVVAVVAAATRDSPGGAGATTVPGTDPTVASSTTPVTTSSTTVPTTVAPTTVPATTSAPTTAAPTTVAPTAAPTVAPAVGPTVVLNGPTQIAAGELTLWTVVSTNATAGIWSMEPPMQLKDPSWSPDSAGFQGSFNPGVYTLTLSVVDGAGNTASNFITFTVT